MPEMGGFCKAQMTMKSRASPGKPWVIRIVRPGNGGMERHNMLCCRKSFQCFIQHSSYTQAVTILPQVYGCLRCPGKSGTYPETTGIGISGYFPIHFCHHIGIILQRMLNATPKFFYRWHLIFISYCGMQHIRSINSHQGFCIVRYGHPQRYISVFQSLPHLYFSKRQVCCASGYFS